MTVTPPDNLGGKNVSAFLTMLAMSEGTDNGRQPTKCLGYDVVVGGGLFTDFSDHPRVLVTLSKTLRSTAAGRYQFLSRTWDDVAKLANLSDFMPTSQDAGAVVLLKRRKAYGLVQLGRFDEAVHACRKEWASLPAANYPGQKMQTIERLREAYRAAGGRIL